jgi:hypothetical protein
VTGIQFITDAKGRKTAAVIDLKRHRALWEDIEGRAGFPVAAARKTYPARKGKGRPDRERKASWLATTSH